MSLGARAFVFIIYLLLGISFVGETALLFWEFGFDKALTFTAFDSHLFLFFPTLGLVALAAFYLPSCAFVDMYWRHIRLGPLRFLVGLITLAVAATFVGLGLADSKHRSVWDLKPETLAADRSSPEGCGGEGKPPCERIALYDGVRNLTEVSQRRIGVREFYRSCEPEPLIEAGAESTQRRFCFASTPLSPAPWLSTDAECCRAQQVYQERIDTLYLDPEERSITSRVHALLLPSKVFFLYILLAISVLLTLRHSGVMRHYPDRIGRIEVGVLVGAVAMIFFPLMSQAFVQSADALFGVQQKGGFRSIVTFMSFLFGAWALLLLLFFFRRRNQELELATKLAGVLASTLAVLKYDALVSFVVRSLGSGADTASLALLGLLTVATVLVMLSPLTRRLLVGEDNKPV